MKDRCARGAPLRRRCAGPGPYSAPPSSIHVSRWAFGPRALDPQRKAGRSREPGGDAEHAGRAQSRPRSSDSSPMMCVFGSCELDAGWRLRVFSVTVCKPSDSVTLSHLPTTPRGGPRQLGRPSVLSLRSSDTGHADPLRNAEIWSAGRRVGRFSPGSFWRAPMAVAPTRSPSSSGHAADPCHGGESDLRREVRMRFTTCCAPTTDRKLPDEKVEELIRTTLQVTASPRWSTRSRRYASTSRRRRLAAIRAVKLVAERLTQIAKRSGAILWLVGQATKNGRLAGTDGSGAHRRLHRRMGRARRVLTVTACLADARTASAPSMARGMFEMTASGPRRDRRSWCRGPSRKPAWFAALRAPSGPSPPKHDRPVVAEVQALVCADASGTRSVSSGVDPAQLALVLGVLERRARSAPCAQHMPSRAKRAMDAAGVEEHADQEGPRTIGKPRASRLFLAGSRGPRFPLISASISVFVTARTNPRTNPLTNDGPRRARGTHGADSRVRRTVATMPGTAHSRSAPIARWAGVPAGPP